MVSSYFSRLTLDPRNADTIYLTGQSIKKSTDGGKTFTIIRGSPGGDDYHDAVDQSASIPEYMITASDQGSVVSVNGGATWSSWYNVPTGQFYYLATDNAFPVPNLLRPAGQRHGRDRQSQRLRRDQLSRLGPGRRR